MAYPSKNVEIFRRVARARLDDAQYLVNDTRTERGAAAVYLAGYVVECALKFLILAATPRKKEEDMINSFRGGKAHDFDHLKHQLISAGGPAIPRNLQVEFGKVDTWNSDSRYNPKNVERRIARKFLEAARNILEWAERRL